MGKVCRFIQLIKWCCEPWQLILVGEGNLWTDKAVGRRVHLYGIEGPPYIGSSKEIPLHKQAYILYKPVHVTSVFQITLPHTDIEIGQQVGKYRLADF